MKTKIIATLVYIIIRILNLTYRYRYVGGHNLKNARSINPKSTFMLSLWHQNIVASIFGHMNEKFTMIVSESKDGELVAVTCELLGHKPVRGSSTRGGKKAIIETIRLIKSGFSSAISVDGPKGPPHEVKLGILEIAKITETPIVPLSPYPSKFWFFPKSWDHFRIPKPFSQIIIVYGEPLMVPKESTKEELQQIADTLKMRMEEGEELAKKLLITKS